MECTLETQGDIKACCRFKVIFLFIVVIHGDCRKVRLCTGTRSIKKGFSVHNPAHTPLLEVMLGKHLHVMACQYVDCPHMSGL